MEDLIPYIGRDATPAEEPGVGVLGLGYMDTEWGDILEMDTLLKIDLGENDLY